jgi:hypothetical protein
MAAKGAKRAYVVVLDGCKPGEIDSGLMPTVKGLRDAGRWYPRASSLPVMETIPNHTMMMTGVRPDRNGVPANHVWDRTEKLERDLDRPTDMTFPTVLERLKAKGIVTGSVLSKEYLHGIFGGKATHEWTPFPVIPVSGHAPDLATMQAALDMIAARDPQLMFINLGDIDRVGHTDLTGTTARAMRQAALASSDQQVKRLVDQLKANGTWATSMVVVLADHSMDWSIPTRVISLTGALGANAGLAGQVQVAQNGGADLVYWTGSAGGRAAAVGKILSIARQTEGVLAAYDVAATPSLRLGPVAGDVLVYCKSGWRFSDPHQASNPIPGNHGHPATAPIPFFISGGHPAVRKAVLPHQAHTVDVAPTVGAFFGLGAPSGGYDGVNRL